MTSGVGTNYGEFFAIDPSGASGNYTARHAVPLDGTEGRTFGPLVQAGDGNYCTTATTGGAFGKGAIVRITPAGQLTVVYSFDPARGDGLNPQGGLTLASDGFLYGTTFAGGDTHDNGSKSSRSAQPAP